VELGDGVSSMTSSGSSLPVTVLGLGP
jgi:hypothetical protein